MRSLNSADTNSMQLMQIYSRCINCGICTARILTRICCFEGTHFETIFVAREDSFCWLEFLYNFFGTDRVGKRFFSAIWHYHHRHNYLQIAILFVAILFVATAILFVRLSQQLPMAKECLQMSSAALTARTDLLFQCPCFCKYFSRIC